MENEETEFNEKNDSVFFCKICDFKCSYLSDWTRHTYTRKHKVSLNGNNMEIMETQKNDFYECKCGKQYMSNSGLWKHLKICKPKINDKTEFNNENTDKQLIMMIIKDNIEFKNMMIEQQKSMMDIIKNGTHNTTNNKTFNLQLFLNETCKDAINLSDFVNQIQLSINDLEETGKLGYAEGISKVFIKNLNGIDFTKRPIHCCDSKRETLYIKDENQWSKDDVNKSILTNAIKKVANKNIKQINEWQKKYPEYSNPNSKQNDKYIKIILNSMSGSTQEEADKNYDKIIRNVIKETIIEKYY
jgi:hypothetical protein